MDQQRLRAILNELGERLEGDWILIGGALVAAWLSARRTTEDIDLIGLADSGTQRLALMRAGSDLGLPIEALNSAADFLLLKMARLSEQDLEDCIIVLEHNKKASEPFDKERVLQALAGLRAPTDANQALRRATLLQVIQATE